MSDERMGFKDWMGIANTIQGMRLRGQQIDANERSLEDDTQVDMHLEGFNKDPNYQADKTNPNYSAKNEAEAKNLYLKIKQEQMNFDVKARGEKYQDLGEAAAKGVAQMITAKDTDGSVKDKETYRAGFEKMLKSYDHVNDRFDIEKVNWDSTSGEKSVGHTMIVRDHQTGKLEEKPLPSEADVKTMLKEYYTFKGNEKMGMSAEGFKKFNAYGMASDTDWKEWNAKERENKKVWKNADGEKLEVVRQFDFRGTGKMHNVYLDKQGNEAHGPEADKRVEKLGFKSPEYKATQDAEKTAETKALKDAADLEKTKADTGLVKSKTKFYKEGGGLGRSGSDATEKKIKRAMKIAKDKGEELSYADAALQVAEDEKFKSSASKRLAQYYKEMEDVDLLNTPAEAAKIRKAAAKKYNVESEVREAAKIEPSGGNPTATNAKGEKMEFVNGAWKPLKGK